MSTAAEQSQAIHERDLLAQAMWDARKALGFDNDGDPTPAASIAGMGYAGFAAMHVEEAKEQAADYWAALDEIPNLSTLGAFAKKGTR